MNNRIAVRKCEKYDVHEIHDLISDIYTATGGPDPSGKKVLLKPNVLLDAEPERCISTHPVVIEAMIRFLQSKGQQCSLVIHHLCIFRTSHLRSAG